MVWIFFVFVSFLGGGFWLFGRVWPSLVQVQPPQPKSPEKPKNKKKQKKTQKNKKNKKSTMEQPGPAPVSPAQLPIFDPWELLGVTLGIHGITLGVLGIPPGSITGGVLGVTFARPWDHFEGFLGSLRSHFWG